MNKNRTYARAMAAVLSITMAAGMVLPANAEEQVKKDENVYVNLNQDGSVSGVYVVNEYMLDEDTQMIDYGKYSSVKNLTSNEELAVNGDEITANAEKGKFFYQGDVENPQLPWTIHLSYYLDGKEMEAQELAGKSGKLEIHVELKENPQAAGDFFDNYLVQGTITLNTDQCSNISAEGATQANVGKNRQLLYNIMAGQEKTFTISADVKDFEMESISFQAVPMSFDIDSDSLDTEGLTDKTDEIKDAAGEFDDGASQLDDGAGELLDGAGELHSGAGALLEGTAALKSGAEQTKDGSSELADGAKALYSGARSLNSGMKTLKKGSSDLNEGISGLDTGASDLNAGAKNLKEGAKQAEKGSKELQSGTASLSANLDLMVKSAEKLKTGIGALTENSPELVKGSKTMLTALEQIQSSLESITVGGEQMQTLLGSSDQILSSIEAAQKGAKNISGGLNAIQGNYGMIDGLKAQNQSAAEYLRSLASTAAALYSALPSDLVAKYAGGIDVNGAIGNAQNIAGLLDQNSAAFGTLTGGIDAAAQGAAELDGGLSKLQEKYKVFNEMIQKLPVILKSMITQQIQELKNAIDLMVKEYKKLDAGIGTYTQGVQTVKEGYDTLYDALVQVQSGVQMLASGADQLAAGNTSLASGSQQLSDGTETLKKGTAQLLAGSKALAGGAKDAKSGSKELADGVKTLLEGAKALKTGNSKLYSGTSELYDGTSQLYDGTVKLKDGAAELKDGTAELKDGTGEFADKTSDIDTQVENEIDKAVDEIAGGDYQPVSFVSDKNKNVDLVQFVMKTDPVKIEEEAEEEPETETESVMEKLKDLF
ncbi:MAG: hypothetical protein U0M33_08330 [Lachnospiraceae bacterium]|nr:hypothetical protein [Lachnospiraceae bacterium]